MSQLEAECLRLIEQLGLPAPDRQHPFPLPPLGPRRPRRTARFDFAWPGRRLAIEVHGGIWTASKSGHTSGIGVDRNADKANHAQLAGWTVLTFTDHMLRDGRAQAALEQAFAEKGSTP